jgi:hypothetical protein
MPPLGVQIGYISLGMRKWLWVDRATDGKWALRFVCHGDDILQVAKITRAVGLEAEGGTECHAKVNLVYEAWEDLVADLKQFADLKLVELFGPEKVLKARRSERARLLARVILDTQPLGEEMRARIISKILG